MRYFFRERTASIFPNLYPVYTVAEREYYPRLSRILRARHRILLSLFLPHVGKPEGLLRATAAADLDRYTTQVSQPEHTGE